MTINRIRGLILALCFSAWKGSTLRTQRVLSAEDDVAKNIFQRLIV
jgi:hypothetical protein